VADAPISERVSEHQIENRNFEGKVVQADHAKNELLL